MRIIVVGDGKVGHALAEELSKEHHDVTIIDNNSEVLKRSEDLLDVLCVQGNGANAKTLLDAEADKADIIIAATASDETNMLCCLIAKRLGAKYSIARIRDPEYNESLTLLKAELGIDMTINPERAAALEINKMLRFPFSGNIESFAKGHVEMVEFRVQESDHIVGHPLHSLSLHCPTLPRVLYAAVERNGVVTIPNGSFVIQPGDRVYVAADMVTITSYFRHLGRNAHRVKNALLLGGSRISFYLARMLASTGVSVKLVELSEKKARLLDESLPGVDVILGDGTDQELLEQEGIRDTDAFVALMDRDEENLITGLFAVHQQVNKVIVKSNHITYADVIASMGLDNIVSPRSVTVDNILRYVRARVNSHGTTVEKLYRLVGGKAEALEFIAKAGDPYIGIPLKDLTSRPGTLVAVIVRKGKVIVPFGNDHIEGGDSVVIISSESGISDLNEVIRK